MNPQISALPPPQIDVRRVQRVPDLPQAFFPVRDVFVRHPIGRPHQRRRSAFVGVGPRGWTFRREWFSKIAILHSKPWSSGARSNMEAFQSRAFSPAKFFKIFSFSPWVAGASLLSTCDSNVYVCICVFVCMCVTGGRLNSGVRYCECVRERDRARGGDVLTQCL